MLDLIWREIRYAFRMILQKPAFAVVAVLTLALGIGANTAIFSIVNAVLLRPLPYPEPDSLVRIKGGSSYPDLQDLKARTSTLENFAGYRPNFFDYNQGAEPERIQGSLVSGDLFQVLHARAALGRTIRKEDDQPGGANVVVISSDFWKTRTGGDPTIVGKTLLFDGKPYSVIGVMPSGFQLPQLQADVFAPLRVESSEEAAARGAHSLRGLGRIKKQFNLKQAQNDADRASIALAKLYPEENTDRRFILTPLHEYMIQNARPALLVLLGAVGLVLLIGCTNIANLLLARAAAREKEMAVRVALGAGRLHLIRQLLIEYSIIAFTGGALGLLLALWISDLLARFTPETIPRLPSVPFDTTVVLFAVFISVLTVFLFGLFPALQASRFNISHSLKETRLSLSNRPPSGLSVRNLMVISEVALALILLTGAVLLLRSFYQLRNVDPGFQTQNRLTMNINLPQSRFADIPKRTSFFNQILQNIETLPGVKSVGATSELPFGTGTTMHNLIVEGRPPLKPGTEPEIYNRSINPDYFRTMGIPLSKGRTFTSKDHEGSPAVGIINETMAQKMFANEEPVGKRVRWAREEPPVSMTIVGVVPDVRTSGLQEEEVPAIYTPYAQERSWWKSWMNLVVYTAVPPQTLAQAIRKEVAKVDRTIPVADMLLMEELIAQSMSDRRFNLILLTCFAGLALLLASIGIYGVIAYLVSQRTREIGIRVALGATRQNIVGLIVGHALLLTVIGIFGGLIVTFVLSRFIRDMLFGISPGDPVSFFAVTIVFAAVALLSSYIPARRALRVNPITALRYE